MWEQDLPTSTKFGWLKQPKLVVEMVEMGWEERGGRDKSGRGESERGRWGWPHLLICSRILVAYHNIGAPLMVAISVAYPVLVRHQCFDHLPIISGNNIGGVPYLLYTTDIGNIGGVPVLGTPPIYLHCILKYIGGVQMLWYATNNTHISGVPGLGTPLILYLGLAANNSGVQLPWCATTSILPIGFFVVVLASGLGVTLVSLLHSAYLV